MTVIAIGLIFKEAVAWGVGLGILYMMYLKYNIICEVRKEKEHIKLFESVMRDSDHFKLKNNEQHKNDILNNFNKFKG